MQYTSFERAGRMFRGLIIGAGVAVALLFSSPACADTAARSAVAAGQHLPLRAIGTAELLDILAANHGKVILVNFFAEFCGPCRKEIPELMQMRKEISEEDLVIIGIAIDHDIREADAFVKSMDIASAYPVYYGGEELSRSYHIGAIPFNVIYNRRGRIEVSEAGYVPAADMKQFLMGLIRR